MMAILKSNLIHGEKPVFGKRSHINYVQKIEKIWNGESPILVHEDFEGICVKGGSYFDCEERCRCSKSKASFNCINCGQKHEVVSGYNLSSSPINCKCGFTYSELQSGYKDEWFLIQHKKKIHKTQ